MIKLEQFSCGYPGHPVLAQADLEIAPGEITVVIGQNGSGKSTLAQVLAGLKLDFRGQVWLDDLELKRSTPMRKLRQKVGLVLQNPDHQILFGKVADEINFALQNLRLPEMTDLPKNRHEREQVVQEQRRKIIRQALSAVGLEDKIEANPRELSGGQKQRLAIASVLALNPEYLVLDEATSMLDLPSRRAVYRVLEGLKKQGIGIVMMTNLLDEILLADKVVILDAGRVIISTSAEIIRHQEMLTQYGLEVPMLLQVAKRFKVSNLNDLRAQL